MTRMVDAPGSYAEWSQVTWSAGTITALARDANGAVVAKTERHTNTKPSSLSLSLDAPSAATGTGSALLLDGHDAALLRASVVDASGRVAHLATNNISFRVVSGPGVLLGSHNGDPHCHEPNNAPWHSAYHGLVRAVVRVTSVAARPQAERSLLATIDVRGPMATALDHHPAALVATDPIIVEATSAGFDAVRLTIPVSTDEASAGVMSVAQAGAGQPVDFFG